MNDIVLVIDDNEGVRTALSVLFEVNDIPCITAAGIDDGLRLLDEQSVGLVVQDMNFTTDTTSGREGVELFHRLRDKQPDLPIILLTAWTHLETAVDLVRAGAADYLAKPWDDQKLVATARNLLELNEASAQVRAVTAERQAKRSDLAANNDLCGLIYRSQAMHELLVVATKVARSDVPVLITGPNGAGKEKLADIVHANSQQSADIVKVNVGALPADLMEAELFGAEAGAFTGANTARVGRFEAADKGTLFLDEIGNLSLEGQAKLLRVLQTGEFQRLGSSKTQRVEVRVISATNADLPAAVAAGTFREDLYYRLNVIELALPPLAERVDDILPLAEHFLEAGTNLSPEAERALLAHDWSGNVRELQNCIRRASLLCADQRIEISDLSLNPGSSESSPTRLSNAEPSRDDIQNALLVNGGMVAKAARSLGMSRQALYRRMDKFGIQNTR